MLLGPTWAREAPAREGPELPPAAVALFEEINAFRAENGLRSVEFSLPLIRAAIGHSEEQVLQDYFSHTSPDPARANPWDRAELEGYEWAEICENIYRSSQSNAQALARDTMEAWKSSEGHRANLLSPEVRDIGIGIAGYPNGEYVITLVMGRKLS